jgi:hypothetical protein
MKWKIRRKECYNDRFYKPSRYMTETQIKNLSDNILLGHILIIILLQNMKTMIEYSIAKT